MNITDELLQEIGITGEEWDKIANTLNNAKAVSDFNGHFWVEKDGVVNDDYPWYIDLGNFKRYYNITREEAQLEYERCDNPLTNKVVFGLLKQLFESTNTGKSEDEIKEIIGRVWTEPKQRCCYFNSIAIQQRIGGNIVFGSVFMQSDDKIKKYYIFGVPNADTFHDFKKEFNHKKQ